LLGNRGRLHDASKQITRQWKSTSWVTCALQFDGIRRSVFGPQSYSELFFLDEATAFAAGHRPCATCRRQRYDEFKLAWLAASGGRLPANSLITEIDKVLHKERVTTGDQKATFEAILLDLPPGTFIEIGDTAFLVRQETLLVWSFDGYRATPSPAAPSTPVKVLTPASIVEMFRSGFQPAVHASAQFYT
jgi:hypothetical protein